MNTYHTGMMIVEVTGTASRRHNIMLSGDNDTSTWTIIDSELCLSVYWKIRHTPRPLTCSDSESSW